jgi:hypothetical protein
MMVTSSRASISSTRLAALAPEAGCHHSLGDDFLDHPACFYSGLALAQLWRKSLV